MVMALLAAAAAAVVFAASLEALRYNDDNSLLHVRVPLVSQELLWIYVFLLLQKLPGWQLAEAAEERLRPWR